MILLPEEGTAMVSFAPTMSARSPGLPSSRIFSIMLKSLGSRPVQRLYWVAKWSLTGDPRTSTEGHARVTEGSDTVERPETDVYATTELDFGVP